MDYKPDGLVTQTLEMPKKEGKEGIITSYLELKLTIAQIIKDYNHRPSDGKVGNIVDLMISSLPNVKTQKSIRKERDNRILEETKTISNNDEKAQKIEQINLEIVGEIAPLMDMYTGNERINRVSFVIPDKEIREIMQKANPEHFQEHLDDTSEK